MSSLPIELYEKIAQSSGDPFEVVKLTAKLRMVDPTLRSLAVTTDEKIMRKILHPLFQNLPFDFRDSSYRDASVVIPQGTSVVNPHRLMRALEINKNCTKDRDLIPCPLRYEWTRGDWHCAYTLKKAFEVVHEVFLKSDGWQGLANRRLRNEKNSKARAAKAARAAFAAKEDRLKNQIRLLEEGIEKTEAEMAEIGQRLERQKNNVKTAQQHLDKHVEELNAKGRNKRARDA